MIVLALETATRAGSVALIDGDRLDARRGDASRTHGERLPAELLDPLAAAGRALADVDILAVVTGPGSFTGLRVGIAAVQGLALAASKLVVGVPTLDALAVGWALDAHTDREMVVGACLDGQRGQVFYAAWLTGSDVEAPRPLVEPRAGEPGELVSVVRAVAQDRPRVLVCEGVERYHAVLSEAGTLASLQTPIAAVAAGFAARHPDRAVAPHALRPIYVRAPDAELARARAGLAPAPRPVPAVPAQADVQVERATVADLPAVAALQQRTFTNPWATDALRWEMEHTDVARLYVARADGAIIGYCACWLVFDELHVNSLAVDAAWRRRGVARAIWARVVAEAAATGARSATLEVRRSNDAARALYEALGFKVEGVRRDYYQNPREDALILWHRDVGP
jgi:tRNA threonylcarbamoyl adenosine modification protein YeaZ/ribosomal-protein-alanine acetyltransferase